MYPTALKKILYIYIYIYIYNNSGKGGGGEEIHSIFVP
jgi:hypothetical protein